MDGEKAKTNRCSGIIADVLVVNGKVTFLPFCGNSFLDLSLEDESSLCVLRLLMIVDGVLRFRGQETIRSTETTTKKDREGTNGDGRVAGRVLGRWFWKRFEGK